MNVKVLKLPSLILMAFEVAPLVRRRVVTDEEGHRLVDYRYICRIAELAKQ